MAGVWKSMESASDRLASACEARPGRRAGDKPSPAILVHHPAPISLERALRQGVILDTKAQLGHVRHSHSRRLDPRGPRSKAHDRQTQCTAAAGVSRRERQRLPKFDLVGRRRFGWSRLTRTSFRAAMGAVNDAARTNFANGPAPLKGTIAPGRRLARDLTRATRGCDQA
jgi:hypothetical protein